MNDTCMITTNQSEIHTFILTSLSFSSLIYCLISFHNGFNACQNPATKHSYQKCIGAVAISRSDNP